jgi:hypothetical protein
MALASTRKLKALDVATKFKIIQACENGNVGKSKIEKCYNFKLANAL